MGIKAMQFKSLINTVVGVSVSACAITPALAQSSPVTIQPNICEYGGNAKKFGIYSRITSNGYARFLQFGNPTDSNPDYFPGARIDAHSAVAQSWYFHTTVSSPDQEIFIFTELQAPNGSIFYTTANSGSTYDPSTGQFTLTFNAKNLGYSGYKFHHIYIYSTGDDYADRSNLSQGHILVNGQIPSVNLFNPGDCSGFNNLNI